jgi:hypothetical protein
MKLGAEPKKIILLAGLLVAAIVIYFVNSSPSDSGSTPSSSTSAPATPLTGPRSTPVQQVRRETPARNTRGQRTLAEFKPSLKPKRGEQAPDPATIDPTLRLDLLARLQQVEVEGAHRSIFDFGQPPAPKPDPAKLAAEKAKVPSPIVPVMPEAEAAKAEPPKPQAPPIPLKFYGYISPVGNPAKRAFFVDGEEIHVVNEGDVVKKRYRIVRIGVNSVVVEDTEFKSEQTLPLLEEQQG